MSRADQLDHETRMRTLYRMRTGLAEYVTRFGLDDAIDLLHEDMHAAFEMALYEREAGLMHPFGKEGD